MIEFEIPGRETLKIDNLCLDYNGTIAEDGNIINGVEDRILRLKELVNITVLTADTYGTVRVQCEKLGIKIYTFPNSSAGLCKEKYVKSLIGNTASFGNGFNDIRMFDCSSLRICIIEKEGMCASLISHSDIVVNSIIDAFDLLLKKNRLKATLRM